MVGAVPRAAASSIRRVVESDKAFDARQSKLVSLVFLTNDPRREGHLTSDRVTE